MHLRGLGFDHFRLTGTQVLSSDIYALRAGSGAGSWKVIKKKIREIQLILSENLSKIYPKQLWAETGKKGLWRCKYDQKWLVSGDKITQKSPPDRRRTCGLGLKCVKIQVGVQLPPLGGLGFITFIWKVMNIKDP